MILMVININWYFIELQLNYYQWKVKENEK